MSSRPIHHVLRAVNTWVRPPWPIPVRVEGERLYVQTLDRLAALALRRFSKAEDYELSVWRDLLKPGMTVVDVGANLGLYTMTAARRVGDAGRVHSFEPAPNNHRLLARAVSAAGASNVILHQSAVADASGSLTLFLRPEHSGDHRLYAHSLSGAQHTVEVPVVRLDQVLDREVRVDLIKMDVQGVEGRVLAGLSATLERFSQLRIMFEFWPSGIAEGGGDPRALLDDLVHTHAMRLHHVDNAARRLQPVTVEQALEEGHRLRYTNLLASREPLDG